MSGRQWNSSAYAVSVAVVVVTTAWAVQGVSQATSRAAVPTCGGQPATIVGTAARNNLTGTSGPDVIAALGGNDQIFARGGADIVCGGDGRDSVHGDGASDVLYGGRGGDVIDDALGANQVFGGVGNDELGSGAGDEHLDGGPGRDVADYSAELMVDGEGTNCHDVVVDLGAGSGQGAAFGVDELVSMEGVYSGAGDDTLTGNGADNVFYVGDVACESVRTDDDVDGLGGSDTVTFATEVIEDGSAAGRVTADLQTGEAYAKGNGGEHFVTLGSIERLDGTADYRDILTGSSADNIFNESWTRGGVASWAAPGDVVRGGGGMDIVNGMNGKDDLRGGPGSDLLLGRGGSDQLWGEDGNDGLDGGRGTNENHGGRGFDQCVRPSTGPLVFGCEDP